MELILASTSPYRAQLLRKLHIPFSTVAPETDEQAQPGESPPVLVERLAQDKARAVASQHLSGFIIGSDQLACLGSGVLGKPGNADNAFSQLQSCSGKTVTFLTGLCVINAANGEQQSLVEPFEVTFRQLSDCQIRRYIELEQPFDCAGSFKSEGLGIALFSALNGRDPNALVGLPLIALVDLFARFRIDLFQHMRPA